MRLSRAERAIVAQMAFAWPTPMRQARVFLEAELLEAKLRGESVGDWMEAVRKRLPALAGMSAPPQRDRGL